MLSAIGLLKRVGYRQYGGNRGEGASCSPFLAYSRFALKLWVTITAVMNSVMAMTSIIRPRF